MGQKSRRVCLGSLWGKSSHKTATKVARVVVFISRCSWESPLPSTLTWSARPYVFTGHWPETSVSCSMSPRPKEQLISSQLPGSKSTEGAREYAQYRATVF